jgi:acetamidase/formamidase
VPPARGRVGALSTESHQHSIHSVSADTAAFVWDNAAQPALEVESGATVELEAADASGGQLNAQSTAADVAGLDFARVNPVTGPVFVKGAEPGDVLAVEILELRAHDWGWTALIPGFGLLADEFPEPWLNISQVDVARRQVHFTDGVTLPLSPFPGTIGVAPAEPGQHSVVPPRKWGGNMDIKHLRPGTTLYLPVGVQGALFSVGDTHSAMGDGEVCGTAVETTMDIAVRLSVRKDMTARFAQYHVPAGQIAETERSSYHVCTGIHDDLMEATREATRAVIEHIAQRYDRSREEAYAIASVAVDLRIHEVVDVPNWVVGAFLPEEIFA